MGHAGYAKKNLFGRREPDVLCAAISILVFTVNNSLEELAGEKITTVENEETAFVRCDFEGVLQEKSVFLMDSFVYSLTQLSQKYGEQYLQVKFEEV